MEMEIYLSALSQVAARLRDHAAASVGRLHKKVADSVEMDDDDEMKHTKHR